MPAVNSKIIQADYNDIRNKIVSVMGAGTGTLGWGQQSRINSTAVAEGTRVTVNEWGNLRFDIINAYKHIFGTNPTTAAVAEGNTIRYSTSFTPDTGTLDVPQKQYDDWANTITANRFTVAAGESATTATVSVTRTTAWNNQLTCLIQFYWNNAADARYFFNSGGQIRVSCSRTGGAATSQNSSWSGLLSTAGTRIFAAQTPNTGTSPNDGTNWYRTTSSYQTFYSATGSSPYGSNTFQIQSRCVDVASNSTGTAASGEIRLVFTDGYVDPGTVRQPGEAAARPTSDFLPDDVVDGTLTINVSTLYATGLMVPTGTFTVPQPILAINSISGS